MKERQAHMWTEQELRLAEYTERCPTCVRLFKLYNEAMTDPYQPKANAYEPDIAEHLMQRHTPI